MWEIQALRRVNEKSMRQRKRKNEKERKKQSKWLVQKDPQKTSQVINNNNKLDHDKTKWR